MISPQLHQHVDGFDEILRESDAYFAGSGLKTANVIRVGRPAVIEGTALEGAAGSVGVERLRRIPGTPRCGMDASA